MNYSNSIWHLAGVERTRAADGSVELKRFLPGGAMETVAYDAKGAETGRRLDYLLSDHLGSVVAVVERTETSSGQSRWDVREERAFDPWDACRDPDTWRACATGSVLPRDDGAPRCGFTGHETLGAMVLVHMNGRIYDPALGRFLQADPYVQSGSDLQGLNRYAYVLNNPLNAVDPSGYEATGLSAWLADFIIRSIIASFIETFRHAISNMGGGGSTEFAGSLSNGLIAGATPWGFTSATGASHPSPPLGGTLNRGAVMNIARGDCTILGNGSQGHWFPSAGTGGFLGGPLGSWIGFTLGDRSEWIVQLVLSFRTATQQTGGKHGNGAVDRPKVLGSVAAESAAPQSEGGATSADIAVAFVGGALDRSSSKVVFSVFEQFEKSGGVGSYFSHRQGGDLGEWIDSQKEQGMRVTVIGHGWGANTAAQVVAKGHSVHELRTVDPVGLRPKWRPKRFFQRVAANSGTWNNYDSTLADSGGDVVARVGRPWNDRPQAFATSHIKVNENHVDICTEYCVP